MPRKFTHYGILTILHLYPHTPLFSSRLLSSPLFSSLLLSSPLFSPPILCLRIPSPRLLADGRRLVSPERFHKLRSFPSESLAHVPGVESEIPVAIHPNFRLWVLANRPGFPFLGNNFFREIGGKRRRRRRRVNPV